MSTLRRKRNLPYFQIIATAQAAMPTIKKYATDNQNFTGADARLNTLVLNFAGVST
jgi:hypothetical protein